MSSNRRRGFWLVSFCLLVLVPGCHRSESGVPSGDSGKTMSQAASPSPVLPQPIIQPNQGLFGVIKARSAGGFSADYSMQDTHLKELQGRLHDL